MKLDQTTADIIAYGEKYHFYYNEETRAIVCTTLYKGQMVRGIAKYDPDDAFNMELGKTLSYLRCKQKFARKKVKRAKKAELDAAAAAENAANNLCKARRFVSDAETQLADTNSALAAFEAKLNG